MDSKEYKNCSTDTAKKENFWIFNELQGWIKGNGMSITQPAQMWILCFQN